MKQQHLQIMAEKTEAKDIQHTIYHTGELLRAFQSRVAWQTLVLEKYDVPFQRAVYALNRRVRCSCTCCCSAWGNYETWDFGDSHLDLLKRNRIDVPDDFKSVAGDECKLYSAFKSLCREHGVPEPTDGVDDGFLRLKKKEYTNLARHLGFGCVGLPTPNMSVGSWAKRVEIQTYEEQVKGLYRMMHKMMGDSGSFEAWFMSQGLPLTPMVQMCQYAKLDCVTADLDADLP